MSPASLGVVVGALRIWEAAEFSEDSGRGRVHQSARLNAVAIALDQRRRDASLRGGQIARQRLAETPQAG